MHTTFDPVVSFASEYIALDLELSTIDDESPDWDRVAADRDHWLDRIVYTPASSLMGLRAKLKVLRVGRDYFDPSDNLLFASIQNDLTAMDIAEAHRIAGKR